jgi:hypothetical protein
MSTKKHKQQRGKLAVLIITGLDKEFILPLNIKSENGYLVNGNAADEC